MKSIWLVTINGYNTQTTTNETYTFSSSPFVTSASNLPPGMSANTYCYPHLKQPALLQRSIFSSGTTFGDVKSDYGIVELVNTSGEIDFVANLILAGYSITIQYGTLTETISIPTWTTIFTGIMDIPEITWDRINLTIRDKLYLFDKPICNSTYAGTNSLPLGIEGVATDIKGKRKPKLYGYVFNISPILVNTSKLIYQYASNPITGTGVINAYDKGIALTRGADYTNQSDMETNAPSAGTYRECPSLGCFRLGSTPSGTVTMDGRNFDPTVYTTRSIITDIITENTSLTSGNISSSDTTTLLSLIQITGVWLSGDETILQALNTLLAGYSIWFGFDSAGLFRMNQFTVSIGSSISIYKEDIIKINRLPSKDEGKGIPVYKVKLNYLKNYTQQSTDLAGGVTIDRKNAVLQEYLSITVEDSSILTLNPMAKDIEINTAIAHSNSATAGTAATTEANRLLTLFKVAREMYSLRVYLDPSQISSLDLNKGITLYFNRFNLSSGKYFVIIGLKIDIRLSLVDLTLYG